ncbi:stress-associated endoplasmic reticulum protein 2 isoform X1 [Rhinatrema bivittatum]|uniref:stress-associated endoplasmic reticulum protein 2 isoform X1 n=1 Tax=Rhinatrema bivittatum TaxID=194408 RepID=UPI00112D46D1|nr:stress-associated endoplasmic reticulum protein 2 isoform X1 [Rhinatrema bivittatum]
MVAKQRIRMANEKHSKNITQRGNVAKTLMKSGRILVPVLGKKVKSLASTSERKGRRRKSLLLLSEMEHQYIQGKLKERKKGQSECLPDNIENNRYKAGNNVAHTTTSPRQQTPRNACCLAWISGHWLLEDATVGSPE